MNKILFALLLLMTLPALSVFAEEDSERLNLQKIASAYSIINKFYVDRLKPEAVSEDAINGMLTGLDPHSSYINANEVKQRKALIKGSFEGIGISFHIVDDTIHVISVTSDGPSDKIGIKAGDKIIGINDNTITGGHITNTDIISLLRGKKGSKVKVTILRRGTKLNFSITRGRIPLKSIDACYILDKGIGYIKLSSFSNTTYKETKLALTSLQASGMTSLILDLQNNGGGTLSSVVKICNLFLSEKKEIIYTQGKNSKRRTLKTKESGHVFQEGKLIVLINEYSASASEILAGCMQDWDRAIVVGRRSYGKGLVQKPYKLPDGSEIHLTIARYYTPSGRCIQRPYDKGAHVYNNELSERGLSGELVNRDSIKVIDSLQYSTLVLKRKVYGGGGIIPDVFVAIDTVKLNAIEKVIIQKGILNKVSLSYLSNNKHKYILKNYKDLEKFKRDFKADELWRALISSLKRNEISYTSEGLNKSKALLTLHLKALLARSIWGTNAYYYISNADNNIVNEAFKILSDNNLYQTILPKQP